MVMTQQEREAAYERVRQELGVGRIGTGPDALPLPPRHGGAVPPSALPIEAEMLGVQMYEYEIWARPALPLRERSFITMTVLATRGRTDQLYEHVNNAMNLGITLEEIHEMLVQLSVYAGLPAWADGVAVAREVFAARGVPSVPAGTTVEPRPPTTPEERRAMRERVVGTIGMLRSGTGPDAPPFGRLESGPGALNIGASRLAMEDGISTVFGDYGYGEAWGREGLELRVRSFITMAVLQTLLENDQLHLHINNAVNLGITPEEIHEALAQTGLYAGISGWNNATFVARDVFVRRGIVEAPPSV